MFAAMIFYYGENIKVQVIYMPDIGVINTSYTIIGGREGGGLVVSKWNVTALVLVHFCCNHLKIYVSLYKWKGFVYLNALCSP